ncbi:MAG: protein kinase [Proteobacteria bacterium]|nr:protein kinase [Pseudomonadota bacterium]
MDRQRIAELFESFVEIAPAQREEWLHAHCAGDDAAQASLRQLAAAFEAQMDFLGAPATLAADTHAASLRRETPTAFGRFRVLRPLGVGGMGEVWLAVRDDGEFEQRVAIKQVAYPTPGLVQRFRQERQILARLEHPNIARLIDGGVDARGAPYLAMEYVDGVPITAYAEARGLDLRARLTLFVEVCDAVQFAHRNLIVHRDLKPSNIFVTADGTPKLLDFGIAKVLDATANNATATRLLTPDYAAPEQFAGGAITTAIDVHALGVVLHELLIGKRPRREITGHVAANGIAIPGDAKPPSHCVGTATRGDRARRNALRGDLDRIVVTALAARPAQRYVSAEALADDVRRYLDGRAIAAQGASAAYRMRKFVLRNRIATAAAATIILILIAATAWSWREARIANEQAAQAEFQRGVAHKEATAKSATIDFLVSALGRASPNNQPIRIDDLLEQAGTRLVEDEQLSIDQRLSFLAVLENIYAQRRDPAGTEKLLLPLVDAATLKAYAPAWSRVSCRLGEAQRTLGKFDDARRHIEAGMARAEAIDAPYVRGLCRSQLAMYHADRGELDIALQQLQAALKEADPGGDVVSDEVVSLYDNYGEVLRHLGRLPEARAQHRHELDLLNALGRDRTADAAMAMANLAGCDRDSGFALRAEAELGRANALRFSVGGPSAGLAQQLINQALDRIVLEDARGALALIDRAEAMQRDFVGPQSMHYAQSALVRARALALQGDRAGAESQFAKTEALYAKLLPAQHPMHEGLRFARAQAMSDDENEAKMQSLVAAEARLRALGKSGRVLLPRVLLAQAELAARSKNVEIAANKAGEARAIYAAMADADGWYTAACDLVLARVADIEGERAQAHALAQSAAIRLDAALGADGSRSKMAHALAAATAAE